MPLSILLWLMLWANVNSGPWYLKNPSGTLGYIHAIRTLLPFVVVFLALIIIVHRRVQSGLALLSPVRLMAVYGLAGLVSCLFSPRPVQALYWGSLYLSVFIVLECFFTQQDWLKAITQLVIANWIIVCVYALALIIVGRKELFGEGWKLIGYGIFTRMPTVAEMAMSRSSGIARFAAVPAVIAFSRILQGKGSWRFLWLVPFAVFSAVVITLQSRGAVFGFAAAICLVLLVHRAREKMVFLVVATLVAAVWIDSAIPDRTVEYIYRGQDRVEFLTLTGRTYTWAKGWELFKESPIVGFGPQADRYSLRGAHMHNSYLYALTQSGLLGTIPFVAAWLLAWLQLARLIRKRNEMSAQHRQLLTETGAVFLFFTVRSIPESTAAFFGIDLLIVVPLLAYFDILHRHYSLSPSTDTEQAIEVRRLPWTRPPYRLWISSKMPFRRPGLRP